MRKRYSKALVMVVLLLVAAAGLPAQGASTILHDVRPDPAVTKIAWLSEWFSPLAGTPADTRVFILDSGKPGATVFVAGGTHANEIAGILTAVLLVESAVPQTGRLLIIPNLNNSASTWTESTQLPAWIAIRTPSGTRFFKYGARYTNRVHQGTPDPEQYIHPKSNERLEGQESRNLNRVYPGKPDGTLTERLAWAVMQLLKQEHVDVAFDLHEAGPESRLANMIVANPKNLDMGAMAVLSLELEGIKMKLEPSSESFHGLSHREWGDETPACAFLIETPNPAQSLDSADPAEDSAYPLSVRVATHLASIQAILDAWNADAPEGKKATFTRWPEWENIARQGVGSFLK